MSGRNDGNAQPSACPVPNGSSLQRDLPIRAELGAQRRLRWARHEDTLGDR
jgi:hypothetical protein